MIKLETILIELLYSHVDRELSKLNKAYNYAPKKQYDQGKAHHDRIRKMASGLSDSDIKKLEKKHDISLKSKPLPKEKEYKPKQFGKYTVSRDLDGFRVDTKSRLHDFEIESGIKSEKEAIKIAQDADKKQKEREKKRQQNESMKLGSILKESTEADDFASQIESIEETLNSKNLKELEGCGIDKVEFKNGKVILHMSKMRGGGRDYPSLHTLVFTHNEETKFK